MAIKAAVGDVSGLDRDALHLLSGLGAYLLIVLIFRTWLGAWWPLLLILGAEFANEGFDLTYETWPENERGRQWMESVKDIVTTLLLPMTLLLLSRVAPRLFDAPAREQDAESADEAIADQSDQ
jgi:hypothetical protein